MGLVVISKSTLEGQGTEYKAVSCSIFRYLFSPLGSAGRHFTKGRVSSNKGKKQKGADLSLVGLSSVGHLTKGGRAGGGDKGIFEALFRKSG